MSLPLPISPSPQSMSVVSKLVRFLKSHPLLFLLFLTPGIPEYLSASSQLTLLVISPLLFFGLLLANLGLYGSGVILIREAMIRWRKGWASVFLLQSFSATGRRSWLLRSLARRELGLDRGAADIPFRLQYRPSDLPLRSSLSRTEIQEPSLRDWNSVQHPWSYHRLLCPIRA